MNKLTFTCLSAVLAVISSASAADFALKFETIPAKDVMSFPGGYGAYGQIQLTKPSEIKSEPKRISKHPLYGKLTESGVEGICFRLDESTGDGKGYDQLIIDLNQNGDLRDDPAVGRFVLPNDRRPATAVPGQVLFGPFELPASKAIAGGRPVYYAQAYIFIRDFSNISEQQGQYLGQLRFRAGWYLDTTVELDGIKQKVGVIDSDSNFKVGEVAHPFTYRNSGDKEENWYFNGGDSFLQDNNGSGTFENDLFGLEVAPFGPVLYFGSTPYHVTLAKDCASLKVEPWTEPLVEVKLQPQGDQVSGVTLAREVKAGEWGLVDVGVTGGKIKVPPGNYRFYGCQLKVTTSGGEPLMAAGLQRVQKTPIAYKSGTEAVLQCGGPLTIEVKGTKRKPETYEMSREPVQSVTDSEYILSINATVVGQGGEIYSTYGKGKNLTDSPDRPTFAVTDSSSNKKGSGNLEFG